MKKTFKDEFNEIITYIEEKGLAVAFDNVMGLVNLDRMVDIIIPTQELKVELHQNIRGLLKSMMEVEYDEEEPDAADEAEIARSYV